MQLTPDALVTAAVLTAVRTCARHRVEMLLVVAPAGSGADRCVLGGTPIDALLTAELLVALCVPESLNACGGGIVVIVGQRIAIAGARLADAAATGAMDLREPARLDDVAALTGAIVISVSEDDGVIRIAAPRLAHRTAEPGELDVLLRVLR